MFVSYVMIANGAADQRRAASELARVAKRPLHSLDGRRVAPDGKRITVRSPDGAARSVRAITKNQMQNRLHRN